MGRKLTSAVSFFLGADFHNPKLFSMIESYLPWFVYYPFSPSKKKISLEKSHLSLVNCIVGHQLLAVLFIHSFHTCISHLLKG